jgi:hypothetical protein
LVAATQPETFSGGGADPPLGASLFDCFSVVLFLSHPVLFEKNFDILIAFLINYFLSKFPSEILTKENFCCTI